MADGDTESWLVEGMAPPRTTDGSPSGNDGPARTSAPPDGPLDEIERRRDELWADLEATEKRLNARLVDEVRTHSRELEKKHMELKRTVRDLTTRLDRLEGRMRDLQGESGEIRETLSAMARTRAPDRAEAPKEGVDLNGASFEDLRAVGFSATQAARIVSHREASGGFESLDGLREVPGLPDELVAEVAPRVRV